MDTSRCVSVVITTISLTENNLNNKFRVYPNPANESISCTNNENITILGVSVLDVSGRLVSEINSANVSTLNIQNLEKGIYFLRISTTEGISTNRFVKN